MAANVNDVAKTSNTPNYSGMLYSKTDTKTPFMEMIGAAKMTDSNEFVLDSNYSLADPEQPAISENQSLTAPTPTSVVRDQNTNVTQIFHKTVATSYEKLSNEGAMAGVNNAGQENNAPNELDFQTARKMEEVKRDIEYTFINGIYQKSTGDTSASKTRGLLAGIVTNVNKLATAGELTKKMIDDILLEAYNNGARLEDGNFIFQVNPAYLKLFSELYTQTTGYIQPSDRVTAGYAIKQIVTDFGIFDIVSNRYMPTTAIVGVDLGVCAPVEQPTPGKGNFFREELGKRGAATEYQIFGKIGLDYGPEWYHFKIENLTSPTA